MKTALGIAGIICLLAVAFAVLWMASAADRFLTEARGLVEDTRKAEVAKHAKNLLISAHGVTFDIRQEYTDNAAFNAVAKKQLAAGIQESGQAVNRAAAAFERLADSAGDSFTRISCTAEALRGDLAPPATTLLVDASTAVRSAQSDLRRVADSAERSVGQAGDGVAKISNSTAKVMDSTAGVIAAGKPIVEDGARISHSAANVAEHYEREWTRGSAWSKFKYILNAALQTLWIFK